VFKDHGVEPPPNQPDLYRFLADYGEKLDAVFILTPHKYHHEQAKACLEAGLDVLLEKPMVMNADEARSLIETRDRTGKHLVIAFQGSLSPQVRTAVKMLRSGELGELRSVSATIWQSWGSNTVGTWRQQPDISGGGMLFDTGAHMLNTVSDLTGQNFVEVAAWMDNRGRPVDIMGVVMGHLESGAYVTMQACGDTIKTCKSDIYVFCTQAILRTGAWGERLEMQRQNRKTFRKVPVAPSKGTWEQFLLVRSGQIENPSPPEIGLRMAKLWDAIQASARQGGVPVRTKEVKS
jgi:predicted dehydrogenase